MEGKGWKAKKITAVPGKRWHSVTKAKEEREGERAGHTSEQ